MKTTHDHHPFGRRMHAFGPAMRDRARAAFEDAGVTRRQWHLLSALESTPSTVADLEEAQRARRAERCTPDDALAPDAASTGATADGTADGTASVHGTADGTAGRDADAASVDDDDRRGPRFGRFSRRGFGQGFGPFGRGFGPGFGPHHGFGDRPGRRGDERSITDLLTGLEGRGWVQRDADTWRLTETGAAAVARIRESLTAVRASMRAGIADEDWDTAMSVLQRVAANARR